MSAIETLQTWRPLFRGEEAASIGVLIAEIAEALREPDPEWLLDPHHQGAREEVRRSRQACLSGGRAGVALLHGYRFLSGGREQDRVSCRVLLEQAMDTIADTPSGRGLSEGFLGVAWAVNHLLPILGPSDDDPVDTADEALEFSLADPASITHFDLISGVTGWAVYALSRLPRPAAARCARRTAERLLAMAEQRSGRTTWKTPPEWLGSWQRRECPDGHYNLGMAHGVPGLLVVLGAAHAADVADERIPETIVSAMRWVLEQDRPASTTPRFATWVVPGKKPAASRFAWCYGDPGVSIALFQAARAIENRELMEEALSIARAASDTTVPHPDVVDTGMCHGTAGIGHVFNRLYQATGEEVFAEAARFWFRRTLAMRKPGAGIAGLLAFKFSVEREGRWVPDGALLTGAAGTALALLASVEPVEPRWDSVFLTSLPGPPRASA